MDPEMALLLCNRTRRTIGESRAQLLGTPPTISPRLQTCYEAKAACELSAGS